MYPLAKFQPHMSITLRVTVLQSSNTDNVCVPSGLETSVKLFSYPSYGALGNVLSGCLAFSGLFEGQFEGVDIPFTLFIALRYVLNKNTACLWTLGEVLFATGDNGRYTPANISAAVLLAKFSSPHLHNQRKV